MAGRPGLFAPAGPSVEKREQSWLEKKLGLDVDKIQTEIRAAGVATDKKLDALVSLLTSIDARLTHISDQLNDLLRKE